MRGLVDTRTTESSGNDKIFHRRAVLDRVPDGIVEREEPVLALAVRAIRGLGGRVDGLEVKISGGEVGLDGITRRRDDEGGKLGRQRVVRPGGGQFGLSVGDDGLFGASLSRGQGVVVVEIEDRGDGGCNVADSYHTP